MQAASQSVTGLTLLGDSYGSHTDSDTVSDSSSHSSTDSESSSESKPTSSPPKDSVLAASKERSPAALADAKASEGQPKVQTANIQDEQQVAEADTQNDQQIAELLMGMKLNSSCKVAQPESSMTPAQTMSTNTSATTTAAAAPGMTSPPAVRNTAAGVKTSGVKSAATAAATVPMKGFLPSSSTKPRTSIGSKFKPRPPAGPRAKPDAKPGMTTASSARKAITLPSPVTSIKHKIKFNISAVSGQAAAALSASTTATVLPDKTTTTSLQSTTEALTGIAVSASKQSSVEPVVGQTSPQVLVSGQAVSTTDAGDSSAAVAIAPIKERRMVRRKQTRTPALTSGLAGAAAMSSDLAANAALGFTVTACAVPSGSWSVASTADTISPIAILPEKAPSPKAAATAAATAVKSPMKTSFSIGQQKKKGVKPQVPVTAFMADTEMNCSAPCGASRMVDSAGNAAQPDGIQAADTAACGTWTVLPADSTLSASDLFSLASAAAAVQSPGSNSFAIGGQQKSTEPQLPADAVMGAPSDLEMAEMAEADAFASSVLDTDAFLAYPGDSSAKVSQMIRTC